MYICIRTPRLSHLYEHITEVAPGSLSALSSVQAVTPGPELTLNAPVWSPAAAGVSPQSSLRTELFINKSTRFVSKSVRAPLFANSQICTKLIVILLILRRGKLTYVEELGLGNGN